MLFSFDQSNCLAQVLGQIKNATIVLGGVLIFGNVVTSQELFGYTLSVTGFFIYTGARTKPEATGDCKTETTVLETSSRVEDPV
jgi:hypothetical protein